MKPPLLYLFLFIQATYAIHERLSPRELHHIFGTKRKNEVPEYWLDSPKWSSGDGKTAIQHGSSSLLTLRVGDVEHRFRLHSKSHLLAADFHRVERHEWNSTFSLGSEEEACIFEGHSETANDTFIALAGCGNEMRGLVISPDGHYLVHPNPIESNHIIHKRSTDNAQRHCLFNLADDPYPEDRLALSSNVRFAPSRLAVKREEELTIELAVFADETMWRHFEKLYGAKADAELHRFILATVNNIDVLYSQRSIEPRIKIIITRYEVMKSSPLTLQSSHHNNGDVDMLLDGFCDFQDSINPLSDDDPRHWDHALLFSGYDLYRDGEKTVAGYAPVKGMCTGRRSCTINEGLDFGSVFVVSHEMGHSLGMYHDGDNECDLRCCIMSPSVGSGKTQWSSCSINEMNQFVRKLGEFNRPPHCLRDRVERSAETWEDGQAPGQKFPLDEQCAVFHGQCWKHELRDGQLFEDVCKMVWCGNGEGIVRTAHPALEGTYCSAGKWCQGGNCVPVSTMSAMMRVDGGWGGWFDSCSPTCVECSIKGQIRVRRSNRACNNPSPNNGGRMCVGSDSRGLACDSQICDGLGVVEYATQACRKLRDDPDTPNLQLSGDGLQFEQAPCKVWCQMALSNNIRTISNFPDGTPCGTGKFCVKGECLTLSCGKRALVGAEDDCPEDVDSNSVTNHSPAPATATSAAPNTGSTNLAPTSSASDPSSTLPSTTPSTHPTTSTTTTQRPTTTTTSTTVTTTRQTTTTTTRPTTPTSTVQSTTTVLTPTTSDTSVWSAWSAWSACNVATCWQRGLRVRARQCFSGPCRGPNRQRGICRKECPGLTFQRAKLRPGTTEIRLPDLETIWGEWTSCSVTCGTGGIRVRRKLECSLDCVHREVCEAPPCTSGAASSPSQWSTWTSWTVCTPCTKKQRRRRFCTTSDGFCVGPAVESTPCPPSSQECDGWDEWSEWTACSRKCGDGLRARKRQCLGGPCFGDSIDQGVCVGLDCFVDPVHDEDVEHEKAAEFTWSVWSEWTPCSTSCGRGFTRRTRKCRKGECKGKKTALRQCHFKDCLFEGSRIVF